MAIGLGTLFSATFFSKHKKKFIFGLVALTLIGLIYGGMKWDAWRIENLKEDLQKERQANVQNTETIEEQGRLNRIDEEALTELLDNRDTLRRETDESMQEVINDVRRILQSEREQSREKMAELDRRLKASNDEPVTERVLRETTVREVDRPVSDRVAERLSDGMWDTYCDGVPDDRVCTERQSDAQGTGNTPTE